MRRYLYCIQYRTGAESLQTLHRWFKEEPDDIIILELLRSLEPLQNTKKRFVYYKIYDRVKDLQELKQEKK